MTDVMTLAGEGTKEWGITKIPQFDGKKAFVVAGAFQGDCVRLLAEAGFTKADSLKEADVVVFTGGSDVNPALYNQKPLNGTSFNAERDIREEIIYKECIRLGKIMFGICRGMQFLSVMNGCELWQHVENHAGRPHLIYDIDDDVTVMASSYHHQMVIPNDKMDVIAICDKQLSRVFINADLHIDLNKDTVNALHELEVEAGAFHETKCFMVQGHPEVGPVEYKSWCMTKLYDLMMHWNGEVPNEVPIPVEEKVID